MLLGELQKRTKDQCNRQYFEYHFDNIKENSKLRTYITFKQNATIEPYLLLNNIPVLWRKVYSSIRLSCHDLEIERGRYIRPIVPAENRVCKLCKTEAETELHFVMACPEYTELRKSLFQKLVAIDKSLIGYNIFDKFVYLFSNKNEKIIRLVIGFVYAAYKLRKEKIATR